MFFLILSMYMETGQDIFLRSELLLGTDVMRRMGAASVIVFGVGGVGSWCAESLVRSGIGRMTIVDSDCVSPSNVNRQLMATTESIGRPKVEVLRRRLLSINPAAEITALQKVFCEETAEEFHIGDYDYIIDAIDSLKDKALLILMACQTDARLFSSMGAALKMDPQRIRVTEFWKVEGDPLARALRKRFKSKKLFPERKFQCVWSPERLENKRQEKENGRQVNGTIVHTTAIFGFTLASLVVQDIAKKGE